MVHTFQTVVTGTTQATATPVRSSKIRATWLQIYAPVGNAAPIVVYGVEPAINTSGQQNQLVASTSGVSVVAGASMFFPWCGAPSPYDLSLIWCTSTNGTDTIQVVYMKV